MNNDPKHIRMKIGDAEFEADVPSDEVVQQMYDRFLAAIEKRAPEAASKKPPLSGDTKTTETPNGSEADGLVQRIFELRPDGFVALKMLPKGEQKEADAFLLILYGYRKLKGEETILGTHLLRAAEFSGLQAYRPAHALAVHERYVIRGGYKKGSTYALNNQGIVKAEEIAAKIFE